MAIVANKTEISERRDGSNYKIRTYAFYILFTFRTQRAIAEGELMDPVIILFNSTCGGKGVFFHKKRREKIRFFLF